MQAGFYYEILRHELPDRLRTQADAFLGRIFDDLGQDCPERSQDLDDDAAIEFAVSGTFYSMRPETARAVLAHARSVPWPAMENIATRARPPARITRHDVCDIEHFRVIVGIQESWLEDAVDAGRGLIVLLSH
ncbi:hypothetical protein [Embleya sp. NPDC001921]